LRGGGEAGTGGGDLVPRGHYRRGRTGPRGPALLSSAGPALSRRDLCRWTRGQPARQTPPGADQPPPGGRRDPAPGSARARRGPRDPPAPGSMTDELRPLRSLARALGVHTRFIDGLGKRVTVGPETLVRVSAALGAAIERPADARDALRALEEERRHQPI